MDPVLVNQIKLHSAIEKASVKVQVFLAGPFIAPNQGMPVDDAENIARRARFYLFEKIREFFEIPPALGEHDQPHQIMKAQSNFGVDSGNVHVAFRPELG